MNATIRTTEVPAAFWIKHNRERTQARIAKAEDAWTPGGTVRWCAACGATLNPEKASTVHIVNGGGTVLHPQDESLYVADGGDMGFWDLGPECARLIPAEFRSRCI